MSLILYMSDLRINKTDVYTQQAVAQKFLCKYKALVSGSWAELRIGKMKGGGGGWSWVCHWTGERSRQVPAQAANATWASRHKTVKGRGHWKPSKVKTWGGQLKARPPDCTRSPPCPPGTRIWPIWAAAGWSSFFGEQVKCPLSHAPGRTLQPCKVWERLLLWKGAGNQRHFKGWVQQSGPCGHPAAAAVLLHILLGPWAIFFF